MNKKILISLGIIGGLLFVGGTVFADDLKEVLEVYLKDSSLDLLGRKYDKILFENINKQEFIGKEFIEKLKSVGNDIKTLPLQVKCSWKIINQKPNMTIYGFTGASAGLKATMGAKAFNEMLFKILKIIFR